MIDTMRYAALKWTHNRTSAALGLPLTPEQALEQAERQLDAAVVDLREALQDVYAAGQYVEDLTKDIRALKG